MIITCDECSTNFRLDESLLNPKGSKVRCSRCNHVFTALPPFSEAGFDQKTAAPLAMDIQFDSPMQTHTESDDHESDDHESDDFESDDFDFDDSDFDADISQGSKQTETEITFEDSDNDFELETDLSFEMEEKSDTSPLDFEEQEVEIDSEDLDDVQDIHTDAFEDEKEPQGIAFEGLEPDSRQELTDDDKTKIPAQDQFLDMDLNTTTWDKPGKSVSEAERPSHQDLKSQDLNFELENDFSSYDEVLDQETEPEMDFPREDEFLSSADMEKDTSGETILKKESLDEDEFDTEDYDRDDQDLEIPRPHARPTEKPAHRWPARAPLIQPPGREAELGDTTAQTRKKSRFALGVPVMILLVLFLITAGGYIAATFLGYKIPFLSKIQLPIIQQYLPQKSPNPVPAPDPIPDQKSVTGRFVTNDAAGELFIITGNIKNPAQIPYSQIQIKGTLFQKEKIAAMTQNVYCGNIISEEILKTGDIDDIIAQLKNPGHSSDDINFFVQPGDTIPFMLVFSDLPKNLQNFTVEVIDFKKPIKP